MKPGDIIFCPDNKFGHHRFYEVNGVFLGAENQVSLIEITSLTEKPGSAHGHSLKPEMLVPEPLLRHFTVYQKKDTGDE